MKKKPGVEADLDPKGTRHSRPGAKIADSAIASSKPAKRGSRPAPSRPGATAAARAVAATKGKGKSGR